MFANVAAVVGHNHPPIARGHSQSPARANRNRACDRFIQSSNDAEQTARDHAAGIVNCTFSIMIVNRELQLGPPGYTSVFALGKKLRKHTTSAPSFASVTGSARNHAFSAMRSSGATSVLALSDAPAIACSRG